MKANHTSSLSFCYHKHKTKKTCMVRSFNRHRNHTGRIIINVNLPSLYQVNEVQASIHHLYNIRYVLAKQLEHPL